jgi:PAS domain S-box-containing protein
MIHRAAVPMVRVDPEALVEELQRSREDLRRSEAYLRAVFENALELMGLLAPDGTLLEANRSALAFAGARREDVIGRPFWETVWWRGRPDLQRRLEEAVREGAQGRSARFEATHPAADGRIATIDFSLTPVTDEQGGVGLLVTEGRDITERRQSERRQEFLAEVGGILAAALEYRDPLSEIARLAVYHLADCCIVDVVDEGGDVRRVAVAHAAEPRPRCAEFLERVRIDRTRPHLMAAVLAAKHPILLSEVRPVDLDALAPDEEYLRALRELDPRSLIGVPLLAHGRMLGALLFVSSRPERRYAPEDVRIAVEVAARAALTIENARLHHTEREAIEARDRVLAVVAHDLRSPLHAALIASRTVLSACPGEGRGEVAARRSAEAVARCVERASRLIEDLLEVTRVESGGLSLERASVAPGDLVAEAAETFDGACAEAQLSLEKDVEEALPHVLADRARILQVFSNLIENALKFTPAGGSVRIAAARAEQQVCFSIADTGAGIPPANLARIFDRFWQGRSDRRGTGQGLPIAKGIVEAHGGRIWAESTPGQGSRFCFTLPIDPASDDRRGDAAAAPA